MTDIDKYSNTITYYSNSTKQTLYGTNSPFINNNQLWKPSCYQRCKQYV